MAFLFESYRKIANYLDRAEWFLPTIARLVFAGVLLMYFWVSGLTKIDSHFAGLLNPSAGAYIQIFPRAMEQVSYDTEQLGLYHKIIVLLGTWSEFILPGLIIIGLFTRLAALGMIGFVAVQSLTDLYGHGSLTDPKVFGAWFDPVVDSVISDQRSLWIVLLLILVIKGAGPLSFDRAFAPKS